MACPIARRGRPAASWQKGSILQVTSRARGLGVAAIAAVVLLTSSAASPSPAAAATPADKVIAVAKAQLGDPWRYGATGPYAFDCSGLVIYSFKTAGYGSVIGNGYYRSASSLYSWFKSRGKASRYNPQRGDLVVWGSGSHIGIYIGNGYAISTLTSGVRIHGVFAVTASFTAYLHTGMSGTSLTSTSSTSVTSITSQTRYTTANVWLRSGPSTGYTGYGVIPYNTRLVATKTARDSYGRLWYYAWSSALQRSGWVIGAYTRSA
jgi:cell wall-associated NlpC family hydrolase